MHDVGTMRRDSGFPKWPGLATMQQWPYLFALAFCLLATAAGAAHVTDRLVVGVYAEAGGDGKPLRLISSGTPVEVLASKGDFSQVRLADETQGWVESRYVTEEKPAKAVLLETQAKLRQMGIELAKLREQQAADGADVVVEAGTDDDPTAELRERVSQLERQLADATRQQVDGERLAMLESQSRDALQQLAAAHGLGLTAENEVASPDLLERYRDWLIGAMALVLGFLAGIAFIDHRIRRRYGGFRL